MVYSWRVDTYEIALRARALAYARRQDQGATLPAGPASGDLRAIRAWVDSCDAMTPEEDRP